MSTPNIRKIVKAFIPTGLFRKIEPYGHLAEAVLFNTLYGFPGRKLKVIGVTGTNGKTTTTFLIHRMLHEAGYKTGLMTTVAWGVGDDIRPQVHHMTNVAVPEFVQRLRTMRKAGVEWLVLETTSQGLAQHRVFGVSFSVAVLTNITHEHLDYHGTFERYRDAKKRLFTLADRNRRGLRAGVVNADDPSCDIFTAAVAHPMTYGVDGSVGGSATMVGTGGAGVGGNGNAGKVGTGASIGSDNSGSSIDTQLQAQNVELMPSGVKYTAKIGDDAYQITCNLPGNFNVYNSLAAVAVGRIVGLSKQQIEAGITALEGVEGRMTRLDEGQNFTVIVDYAHTPDSFEKLFKDLRPVVKGRLIVMFGSAGGPRDAAKRPMQGELAGRYADEVVITEEDDRDSDGLQIMEQIAEGAVEAGKERDLNLFLVHDRTEAITFALSRADGPDDMVLLLGKGHEKTIERANGENPWDEIGTARQALRGITGKK